jgi:uncharacterized protein involved in exopolysaccharide biosynthesis
MGRYSKIVLSAAAFASVASAALAQNAPPTYQADPSVYKVIFEDANFRVIEATWKAGASPIACSRMRNPGILLPR